MTHVPSVKPSRIIRALLTHGFEERTGKGSHRVFRHPETKAMTVVPVHSKELSPNFVKQIAKQAGLDVEELLK